MQNNELKKVRIKNRTCYYFDDIIKLEDFDLDNILIDEKSQENILIYDISYKTLIGSKPLRIKFDKIDGIIRIYNRSRYLILFGNKKCDAIYDKIRYITSIKSGNTYTISPYFAKIKVDFIISKQNFIILNNSVLNKDKNHYYYKIFLGKCSYQLAKK